MGARTTLPAGSSGPAFGKPPVAASTGDCIGIGAAATGAAWITGAGIAIAIDMPGVAGFISSRSGLGAKHGLTVAQGVGVIDPDYTGEILVVLLNTSGQERRIANGERIAQLIFQPFMRPRWREVQDLAPTERGSGGFGHTGR